MAYKTSLLKRFIKGFLRIIRKLNLCKRYKFRYLQLLDRFKMSSSDTPSGSATQNLELPSLRSLDDFILGSARFQLPNLKDLDKWGNRVVKNLLYYQTNYFLMFVGIYTLMTVLNPLKILSGLMVKATLLALYWHFFRERGSSKASLMKKVKAIQVAAQSNTAHRWLYLVLVLAVSYILLKWLDALLVTMFTILLPITLTFVHASLRLRNIRNKVVNTMDSFGPSTPMGIFLDAFNITVDNLLS